MQNKNYNLTMAEITKNQDSRRVFIDTLIELAEKDDKVILIVPDVGFNYIEEFQNRFPTRFFNFGVTEQSVILIASAMALAGFKPYVYSMINFVLFRPYEMVRNGIVHHNANVKLLGVKGSSSYKFLGFSHNMTTEAEDLNACHALGLESFMPLTNDEVREDILKTYELKAPAYIRL